MFPPPFRYHRAASLVEASRMLAQLGEEAKVLAGGQSLIPLMKLRLARPAHLVDLNFAAGLSYIRANNGAILLGSMTRHADIEGSPLAEEIPILHDCAAGIADAQVRNRGTLGGSLAEADPSGDWAPVLLTLDAEVTCTGPPGERTVPMTGLITDAYTTILGPAELIREIRVKRPQANSGGAYIAFKRCAPVYATASAAAQLTMDGDVCRSAGIALGCVGLTAIHAKEAEAALRGQAVTASTTKAAAEAAAAAADPQADMRGSVAYKRALVAHLVKRAIDVAARRARGAKVEITHEYA